MKRRQFITHTLGAAALAAAPQPATVRVIVLGFDGLGAYALRDSRNPTFDRLSKTGASTLKARGVMPTVSSPNWASMIMGAGPEQHGVTSNDWEPDKFEFPPTVVGRGGIFPTIFGTLRAAKPSANIACFHDWEGFARLTETKVFDKLEHGNGPDDTAARAIRYLKEHHPDLLFVHFDHVDDAGHHFGHGTKEYFEAVAKADRLTNDVLLSVEAAGLASQTIVLVTADHGGVGKHHGGNTLQELEIPWIINGPGVRKGHVVETPVNTFDTAVTLAYLFRIQTPVAWIGRPVVEAFEPSSQLGTRS